MAPFGKVIPVVGVNNGFLGQVTRTGPRGIVARPVLSTTPNPILFGAPIVVVPDATGGTVQTVADFITANGYAAMTPALFAGVAVREVKTNVVFPMPSGTPQIGRYMQGEMCESLEEGSINVACLFGQPLATGKVYLRVALNGAFPLGIVGGFEAAADGANTIDLSTVGVQWRTGKVDANNVAEITMRYRVIA